MAVKSLDELQWSDPVAAEEMQGIHSNSVLFYFMRSPYFDKTSNNNTVYNQALHNASMFPILETRDRFEDFLRSMSGVEYVVHQAPAEMAPGTGTGVWVIRKQLRRKRNDGQQPDELTVYADYFVVGYNIYQAPTLADILSSRISSMAVSLSKAFPAIHKMQTWTAATGHIYETPEEKKAAGGDDDDDDDDDNEDESINRMDGVTAAVSTAEQDKDDSKARHARSLAPDEADIHPLLAEESFAIHRMYGGEYMDEQVVSGRPGEFHLTKVGGGSGGGGGGRGGGMPGTSTTTAATAATATPFLSHSNKDTSGGKAANAKPSSSTMAAAPKPKRRKSKGPTT